MNNSTPQLLREIHEWKQVQIDCIFELFFCLIWSFLCFLLSNLTVGYASSFLYITYLLSCIGIWTNMAQFFILHYSIKANIAECLRIHQAQHQEKEDLS